MARKKRRDISQKKWLIAIYIRLSRNDGNDESESVVNQRKIILDFIMSYFINTNYKIVGIFIDDGITGTDDENRTEFQRILKLIENGSVNTVVCKTLSRAFRNHADQGYYLEEYFPKHDTRFISIGNPSLDTFVNPDDVYGFEIPINGVVNDRFAYKTSVDVRKTFQLKREKGEFIGAFAPYGYQKDPKNKNHLVIDEKSAKIVRKIFHWYVIDGLSIRQITFKLNELGIPNPTAYKKEIGLNYDNPHYCGNTLWSSKKVSDILTDESYIGSIVQGKQKVVSYKIHEKVQNPKEKWSKVKNKHEPIIENNIFELAQKRKNQNRKSSSITKEEHLLSGFIYCAECHKAMHRKSSKGIGYYQCRTYTESSKSHCTPHSIRENVLKDVLLELIQKEISMIENIDTVIQKIKNNPSFKIMTNYIEEQLTYNRDCIKKKNILLDKLYFDLSEDIISKEQYFRMKEKLHEEIKNHENSLYSLELEKNNLKENLEPANSFLQTFLQYKNIKKLNKGILLALVDRIEITKDKNIKVYFEYQDQLKNILKFIEENKITEKE